LAEVLNLRINNIPWFHYHLHQQQQQLQQHIKAYTGEINSILLKAAGTENIIAFKAPALTSNNQPAGGGNQ